MKGCLIHTAGYVRVILSAVEVCFSLFFFWSSSVVFDKFAGTMKDSFMRLTSTQSAIKLTCSNPVEGVDDG